MGESRNNHYVPRWYQEGFFEPGRKTLAYLDMRPPQKVLPDGRVIVPRARWESATSQCFVQRDLYSTFFGTTVNDEIERRLFGAIDASGAPAIRAFTGSDTNEWIRHFETLFTYLDVQKLRTPKGLDWLRSQYPSLTQNELMMEMQGIRMMNCTIWTEGVREIVSAEDADVKFIVTDHPVTIYNRAVPPGHALRTAPLEPSIALKGSQTLFPLNRDFCLILTNLEEAKAPVSDPLAKRTFARNFRQSIVRADAFIRSRKLTGVEVTQVNVVLKAGARRYIAAGRQEWLHPEKESSSDWRELGAVLRPPDHGLWSFGGETFVKFEDGHVLYQDEFGRTEKPYEALQKKPPASLRIKDLCGCGSDRAFGACCAARPVHLRPSWTELSIRERNLAFYRATADILGVAHGKTWDAVRKDLTDDQISKLYGVFTAFWPLDTDLLALLPKPDGRLRAVYTGSLHPSLIKEFALGASLYFGELIIEHPFVHAGMMRKEFSPIETPRGFRQEVLKAALLLFTLMPLVDCGLVNLVPDLGAFDFHLRDQTMRMAQDRTAGVKFSPKDDPRTFRVMKEDMRRSLLLLPTAALKREVEKSAGEFGGHSADELMRSLELMRLRDPLASLQAGSLANGKDGGQFTMMRMVPNFEMAMYLAQATGACVVTDSPCRWAEVQLALRRRWTNSHAGAPALAHQIEAATFLFPQDEIEAANFSFSTAFDAYPALMQDTFKYLRDRERRGAKANFEAQLAARFTKAHATTQAAITKSGAIAGKARVHVAMPAQGIQDNTVNRLLLMSNSEHHLSSVPMAFLLEPAKTLDH